MPDYCWLLWRPVVGRPHFRRQRQSYVPRQTIMGIFLALISGDYLSSFEDPEIYEWKIKTIYCVFWFLKLVLYSIDWCSCLRRQRKSEDNGCRERARFRQVREEYRRRCRIAIAAAVGATATAAAAVLMLLLLLLLLAASGCCSYCCCCGGGYRVHTMEKPSQPRRRP